MPDFESPVALAAGLADAGYLADEGLAMAGFLALRLHRPIFLEGDAGVGKTAFAAALAESAGVELIRLQCYEGLDASQALYDWDFPRQVLHLRAVETAAHGTPRPPTWRRTCMTAGSCSPGRCCRRSSGRRACCSSTRSTGPTTSSRRTCSRSSPTPR